MAHPLSDRLGDVVTYVGGSEDWGLFAAKSGNDLRTKVLEVAGMLGKPVRMRRGQQFVQEVAVLDSTEGFPRSLSRQFGKGIFPLHTDTAHFQIPCRYIVLACHTSGEDCRGTILAPWSELIRDPEIHTLARTAVFKVRNGSQSFYANLRGVNHGFFRFDIGCMEPADSAAELLITRIQNYELFSAITVVKWRSNQILVIDNWKLLHGREAGLSPDTTRLLLRVLVQ